MRPFGVAVFYIIVAGVVGIGGFTRGVTGDLETAAYLPFALGAPDEGTVIEFAAI